MNLRISLCQMNIVLGDPAANLHTASQWIHEAADGGSQLALLPELWSTGYDLENALQLASPIDSGIFLDVGRLARKNQVWIGGSVLERAGNSVYNTFTLFDPAGSMAACYRKTHLFKLMDEDRWLAPGDEPVLVGTPFGLTGVAVCYDLRFPELFRGYAVAGSRLMLLSAEWPIERVEHWRILLKARAIENQCIVAAVNAAGDSGGTIFGGRSAVIGPLGEVLVEGGAESRLLSADVDLDSPTRARTRMDILGDRRPELYR
ncbi:MAG TPA: carbon-nitrogen family hydrolase [Anaerolineaceae bacterium]